MTEDTSRMTERSSDRKPEDEGALEALRVLREHVPRNEAQLRDEYSGSDVAKEPDTFVLYRIIGNDLFPRHEKGQSRANLQFILGNEPELLHCEKRWVVNRIVDNDEREAIVALLEAHDQHYIDIPFRADEFAALDWDYSRFPMPGYLSSATFQELPDHAQERAYAFAYRHKNNYVMHNNGARNIALKDGRKRAKWVLPWDGNCFMTASAWSDVVSTVRAAPHLKYFVVPMERVTDNGQLLSENHVPRPVEEPQILFRNDAPARFDEAHPYGRRPKVELFWRLGVPGKWDKWPMDPWDLPRSKPSSEAGQFGVAGWVGRLSSGMSNLERESYSSFINRGVMRQAGIMATINYITRRHLGAPDAWGFGSFNIDSMSRLREAFVTSSSERANVTIRAILSEARKALERKAESVTDKTSAPPSGDMHDYFHPAPYWWPNPKTADGLPYIKKDGRRVPGTRLYEKGSEKYDRSRLQRMFDGSVSLALASFLTDDDRYVRHAAGWLRRWFLLPESRMNPHLYYAQVRMGHNRNQGYGRGIIEFKDIYYYLDAVRIIERFGCLTPGESNEFRDWLNRYLQWLLTDGHGLSESSHPNNHGTCYDLQVAAIALFLEDHDTLFKTFIRAKDRLPLQISPNGVQYDEMTRTQTAHYCSFNLQAWLNLARIAARCGDDLAGSRSGHGAGLAAAVDWMTCYLGRKWPYEQIEPFDGDRLVPIVLLAKELGLQVSLSAACAGMIERVVVEKPLFHPHDGIRPFWNLDGI